MSQDPSQLGGWHNDQAAVQAVLATLPMPWFAYAAPMLTGAGAGQTTLLYKAWQDVTGGYVPYTAQKTGDCVSMGWGHGTDLLAAIQIALGRKAEVFKQTATEAIYGMARIDIGRGQMGGRPGATGAWAAKAVSTIGTVSRDVVGAYDGNRAVQWGNSGVPDAIKSQAGAHKVQTVSLVTSFGQLEDALAGGCPVAVCSSQGFTEQRDQQGFCQPSGQWDHCMLICGVRQDRPGACIMQSWGFNRPSGPLGLDQPPNSFWADRQTVDRMLAMQDSWSMSSFVGYPGQPLPNHWKWSDLVA